MDQPVQNRDAVITPAPVRLTFKQVIEAGRKAYLEGRLSAQGPTSQCAYRDDSGRPCVIGAALDDEVAARFDEAGDYLDGTSIAELVGGKLVKCSRLDAMMELQAAHDRWAQSGDPEDEAAFHKLLGITDEPPPSESNAGVSPSSDNALSATADPEHSTSQTEHQAESRVGMERDT